MQRASNTDQKVSPSLIGTYLDNSSSQTLSTPTLLRSSKEKATTGAFSRGGQNVGEVMDVCAGCCGLIHGTDYWTEIRYVDVDGNEVVGYELSAKWENRLNTNPHSTVTINTSNRKNTFSSYLVPPAND